MKSRLTRQFLLLLFSVFIIYAVMFNIMGIIDKITTNNYKILAIQTQSVADSIAEIFREVASSASELAEYTEKAVGEYQDATGLDWKSIDGNTEALNNIYSSISRFYLDAVMRGHTTGIFVYLDAAYSGRDSSAEMSAFYIRNNSPATVGSINYSSLMYYKGLESIIKVASSSPIAYDQFWSTYYSKTAPGSKFILETMKNAWNPPEKTNRTDLGLWSDIFRHEPGDRKIITYCEPFYDRDGNVVGVCGFELSIDYLISLIPNTSLPYTDSAYILADMRDNGGKYLPADTMIINGLPEANLTHGQDNAELISDSYAFRNDIEAYSIKSSDVDRSYTVFPVDIGMYGKRSVYYESQSYFLVGCVGTSELYALGGTVNTLNFITIMVTFVLLGTGLIFFANSMSSKIENLSAQVMSLDTGKKVALGRANITEIDNLAKSFEELSVKLIKNARHLSDVTGLVGVTVAAIEENANTDTVSFSDILYDVFRVKREGENAMAESGGLSTLSIKRWEEKFPMFMKRNDLIELFSSAGHTPLHGLISEQTTDGVFFDDEFSFSGKWYRVRYIYEKENDSIPGRENNPFEEDIPFEGNNPFRGNIYGTMIEITKEIEDRQRFEFERDYDPLTGILNRSSYKARIQQKIDEASGAVGAAIFCDLDGLKTINDTYGHKAGDVYIQATAAALSGFEKYGGIVARLAGDEFVVYLHDCGSKEETAALLKKELESVKNSRADIFAADEDNRIKLSAGVAFYPSDSSVVDELVKYADFAMNEIKRSSKGGIRCFDPDSYERNSYLAETQNYLDIFLEHRRLRFAFQPVIDVQSGEVYGYKALMRPLIREVQNPEALISLAKKEAKLYQVEKLVLETVFEWIRRNILSINKRVIFFNVMGTQNCRPDDWNNFAVLNGEHFKRVVCEITDAEAEEFGEILKKAERFREKGAVISMNGNVGENQMVKIKPEIIKINKDIISGIESDISKQRVFESATLFAKKNNAKVIAEGIENEEELETVIMLGADYVQGFVIGMPSFDIFDVPDKVKTKVKTMRAKYFE